MYTLVHMKMLCSLNEEVVPCAHSLKARSFHLDLMINPWQRQLCLGIMQLLNYQWHYQILLFQTSTVIQWKFFSINAAHLYYDSSILITALIKIYYLYNSKVIKLPLCSKQIPWEAYVCNKAHKIWKVFKETMFKTVTHLYTSAA